MNAALVIFGATLDAPTSSTSATAPNTPTAPAPATASDAAPAAPEPPTAPAPNPALEQLNTLPVKGRAPKTGYERKQFGQACLFAALRRPQSYRLQRLPPRAQ